MNNTTRRSDEGKRYAFKCPACKKIIVRLMERKQAKLASFCGAKFKRVTLTNLGEAQV